MCLPVISRCLWFHYFSLSLYHLRLCLTYVSFLKAIKTEIPCGGREKKKWYPHSQAFFTETKKAWLPLVWEALSKRRTAPGWASGVPVTQRYFRNTVSNVQWWWRDRQDFKARRRLPGELPARSCAVESRSLQAKLGDGKLGGVKVFADIFLF